LGSDSKGTSSVNLWQLLLKILVLFAAFNVLYFVAQPLSALNHVTIYNWLVPGRTRLPFGEYPAESYNISVESIDQMLASHTIAAPKAADEYRVVMLGDSSIWGYLLQPDQTQTACLNNLHLTTPSGLKVRVYNLGYPKLTVMKDFLILRHALAYKPDLIIWSTTLASLYPSDQLDFEVITAQHDELTAVVNQYHFKLYQWPLPAVKMPTWFDHTFFGQRRELADWLRYQLYGLGWAATDIDHTVPKLVTPHPTDLGNSDQMLLVEPMLMHVSGDHKLLEQDLSLDIVKAGIQTAAESNIPVLLINEPMYRSNDSPVRWNFYYPKWAYDSYRDVMKSVTAHEGWPYLDLWDAAPTDQFTDTDFHMTPQATCDYVQKLRDPLLALAH
jgi:hypothetical protein